jgi:hypothetical protein
MGRFQGIRSPKAWFLVETYGECNGNSGIVQFFYAALIRADLFIGRFYVHAP